MPPCSAHRTRPRIHTSASSSQLAVSWLAGGILLLGALGVLAHNNPTFREDVLNTIDMPGATSFSIKAPEGAVQLIFRVQPADAGVTFSLPQGGKVLAESLGHDGTSNIVQGDGFELVADQADAAPFKVEVVAKVLDRSVGKSSANLALGKTTFKKANCVGCHKWHGGGGGGYGGAAKSLRETTLERDQLIEVVRCGRPATGMPSHVRGAYGAAECYGGVTLADLGDNKPPKGRSSLRDDNIEAVVDYVIATLKGRGEPTKAECIEYWGDKSRACSRMN